MKRFFTLVFFFISAFGMLLIQAQSSNVNAGVIARQYLVSHLKELGLTSDDLVGMTVQDQYTDHESGITRIYFLQHKNEIPVYNAILNLNITKEGKVFYAGNRFVSNLASRINTTKTRLDAHDAIQKLVLNHGLPWSETRLKSRDSEDQFVFDQGLLAREDILVKRCYQPDGDKVRLAWDVLWSPVAGNDKWSARIDAVTGALINENNWTTYCNQGGMAVYGEDNSCQVHPDFISDEEAPACPSPLVTGAQYNVWPAPVQSPNRGPRTIVTNPADPIASPFGWHDVDGQPGPEYTITEGNNVHAFQDRDSLQHSSNDEPDGGPDLHFDFPIDFNSEPDQYLDASVVNLFYWNNYMHDFAYHFGFTEEAGNFQQNNYGKGGVGDDAVNALAQQGANTGNKNNAYFTANLDGTPGHMAVYVFKGSKEYLTIKEPAAIAGRYKTSLPSAGWGTGSYVNQTPVSGEVVAVNDGVESPYATDACDPILNASALAGKIALITRGGCQFGWKALQLQNAGAIGIICCNFDDNDYTMNPGTYGAQVHIPIIMIGLTDTQTLTPFIGNGLKATLVDPGQQGPEALDGDFDGGMIAHEYGHGISRRLVGGPNTFCLSNAENMGEGWSDFIMLAVTAQQGDSAKLARGFCTYGFNQPPTGAGYRRHAYSTDMSINPLTYGDVAAAQETHDMGEIWGSTLWEMYWGLVDQYGWSANPYDESSGNFRAIKLVFEGLKNTPCSPGYVDGRNAILAADETLYNGEDICTIWKAFAKRGIGYSADQGSPDDAGDQKEAFDLPPTCSNSMLLKKSVTDFIQPGENIDVTLQVGNYKSNTVSGVRVTDEIPSGTQYKSNSANVHATIEGNHIVFDLGNLPQAHDTTITYTLETRIDQSSSRIFMDSVNAASAPLWKAYTYGDEVSNTWTLTETYPGHSGQNAWNALETSTRNRQILELNADAYTFHVEASHPVLRFYHRYQTKAGSDGGIVEVSEVGTNIWKTVEADMIRNGYSGKINYLPFAAPDLKAFYGNSGDDYKATYIDLSAWAGKDIVIRFRFGTDLNTNNGFGWLIDDIEFMDMLAYDGEACVTSDQGDQVCAIAPEGGTIVDSREGPLSAVPGISNSTFNIFPNPANDEITVVSPDKAQPAQVNLITLDGKLIRHIKGNMGDSRALRINTQDVPSGMYLIQVVTAAAPQLGKVIVEH